jgi:Fic family protein
VDPLAALVDLPGVSPAVDRARAAVDELLTHRVLRARSAEVSSESALRGARASAALEGADWTLDEIRALDPTDDRAEASTVAAALRVSTEVGPMATTWERAPLQVLARLHLVAASPSEPTTAGRPRPSGGDELTARLDALAQLVTRRTTAPALVIAGVAHGELLALQPFPSRNGLVARAATRLVLITRGVDPKAVSVPEVGYAESRQAYADAAAAYAGGTPEGVARWLAHCCDAVMLGAREGLAVCEALRRG